MAYWVAIANCRNHIAHALVNMDEEIASVKAAKYAARKAYGKYAEHFAGAQRFSEDIPVLMYVITDDEVEEMTVDHLTLKVAGRSEDIDAASLTTVDFRDITDC